MEDSKVIKVGPDDVITLGDKRIHPEPAQQVEAPTVDNTAQAAPPPVRQVTFRPNMVINIEGSYFRVRKVIPHKREMWLRQISKAEADAHTKQGR